MTWLKGSLIALALGLAGPSWGATTIVLGQGVTDQSCVGYIYTSGCKIVYVAGVLQLLGSLDGDYRLNIVTPAKITYVDFQFVGDIDTEVPGCFPCGSDDPWDSPSIFSVPSDPIALINDVRDVEGNTVTRRVQGLFDFFNVDANSVGDPFTVTLTAVPEPPTWGLAIAGLGLLGAALRTMAGRRGSRRSAC
jgi:hypothetical protein